VLEVVIYPSPSGSSDNMLIDNIVCNNTVSGIVLEAGSNNNTIYNNIFNNTNNTQIDATSTGNVWNTSKTAGPNIIGGSYLGGNYWAKPEGTGFSQINVDTDGDGFCDSPLSEYELNVNNIDHLPLYLTPPIEKTEFLKDYVNGLEGVDVDTKEALSAKLNNSIHHLEKGNEDKAIKKLENFIGFVEEHLVPQDRLSSEQAEYMINEANRIIELIQNSEG
jgi:parallel beta-helix repeat protein